MILVHCTVNLSRGLWSNVTFILHAGRCNFISFGVCSQTTRREVVSKPSFLFSLPELWIRVKGPQRFAVDVSLYSFPAPNLPKLHTNLLPSRRCVVQGIRVLLSFLSLVSMQVTGLRAKEVLFCFKVRVRDGGNGGGDRSINTKACLFSG
jgi:hypothetical protein